MKYKKHQEGFLFVDGWLLVLLFSVNAFFVTVCEDYVCWEIEELEDCSFDAVLPYTLGELDKGMPAAVLILFSSSLANMANYYDLVSTFLKSSGTAI